jgi:hypothetical protein
MVSLTPISINAPSTSSDMDLGTAFKTYVIPVASAIVLSHALNIAIDKMFVKPDEDKQINELYDSMLKRAEASKLPRSEESPDVKDAKDMSSLIEDSIYSLQKAQHSLEAATGKTKCGVCQNTLSKLGSTLKNDVSEITEGTKGIMSASKKYSALKTLKKSGRIDQKKKWLDLDESEKELVRKLVED